MMRKKNNKGTRVMSYGLVTTARSNEKQPLSPGQNAEPEKDKNPGNSSSTKSGLSKIAARINRSLSMTGKGKESKEKEKSKTPKSIETGKESKEKDTFKIPKCVETGKEETLETPKSVETFTEQEPETGNEGSSADDLLSIQQDKQPSETGNDGKSVDDTSSIKQDPQPENEKEGPLVANSLPEQKDPGTKDESRANKPENGNEQPLQNNSFQMQGTSQKCMICDKTVYLVDQLTANNRVYHKSCFRCNHCNRTLKLGNFNSFEKVLYCRPHFDQLFKQTGSLDKSFQGAQKVAKQEKTADNESPAANKLSTMFARTTVKCVGCNKTVYPTEKVTVNGTPYHKSCFKCSKGGCTISLSNYIAFEGRLYCKHHHIQLIKEKGNLSQLEADNGKEQGKESNTIQEAAV